MAPTRPPAISLSANNHALKMVKRGSRFLQRRPLLAKALPCAFGFAFGDILTQYFHAPRDALTGEAVYTHDFVKSVKMAGVGGVVAAPVGLFLYRWMDAVWPGAGLIAGAAKFTADQVVGCIIWQAAYLTISESYRAALATFLEQHPVHTPIITLRPAANKQQPCTHV